AWPTWRTPGSTARPEGSSPMGTADIFINGRVFDGRTFLDGPTDVAVADGRTVEVGRALAGQERFTGAPLPDLSGRTLLPRLVDQERFTGATVHDLSGKTRLPGLFDCHVHVTMSGAGGADRFTKPYSLQYYESVTNLAATLAAGITTVRDASGADLGTRTAVE